MSLRESAGRYLRAQVIRLGRPAVMVPSPLEVQPPADIPAAPPYKAPVFPPAPERYFRCLPCDVEWRGTNAACWCCGRTA